jgi:hypothetical protein
MKQPSRCDWQHQWCGSRSPGVTSTPSPASTATCSVGRSTPTTPSATAWSTAAHASSMVAGQATIPGCHESAGRQPSWPVPRHEAPGEPTAPAWRATGGAGPAGQRRRCDRSPTSPPPPLCSAVRGGAVERHRTASHRQSDRGRLAGREIQRRQGVARVDRVAAPGPGVAQMGTPARPGCRVG